MTCGKHYLSQQRNRLRWLRLGVMLAVFGVVGVVEFAQLLSAQGAQTQPLSLSQIQKVIQVQSPDAVIAAEIRRRGLNFAPSKETTESLRRAGAGPDTLQAIDELRPMLDEAKQAIPGVLTKIYQSLDQGNPQAARPLVSSQIGGSADRLDSICRPFTYRAHYIEAVIERPGQRFETHVRVLFRPFEEKAQVFTFRPSQASFLLERVDADPLKPESDAARETVRQFVFAVGAGKWDVASRYASPRLPIERMKSPLWLEYFAKMTSAQVTGVHIIADRGILLLVEVDVGNHSWNRPDFWVDPATGLLVRAFFLPPGDIGFKLPDPDGFRDPDLEAHTLKRFGLMAAEKQSPTSSTSPAAQPSKVGGDVLPPTPIFRPEPPTDKGSKHGTVQIQVLIDTNGFVSEAKVIKSLEPERDESALTTVRLWRFRPATLHGLPVAMRAIIDINFGHL
jgi:TonB family protein